MIEFDDEYFFEEDKMGMTITSGIVTIKKDATNLIGISIGGGAPLCPCLYIVQVFDNTPAAKEGTLESGDELVGVNGASVKGKTKVEVAKMIQACKDEVQIKYNKLHADPQQGKTLDIVLKKAKHRLVENMSAATADALGLSRAILCNDTLVKKLEELEEKEVMYRGLVDHTKRVMKATLNLLYVYKAFGDAFAEIGVREPQPRASEAFRQFGDYHRQMEKSGIKHLRAMKPILADLGTYLNKAIPDTKLTIKKYADTKFEYLSYCLKVKEKDDEEYGYAALQEPLYRVETGNYEYRLLLRCRQEARARFARLRSDVLVKLELLDNKHVQHVVWQLQKLVAGLVAFHQDAHELIKSNSLFPIEMDLTQTAFQYNTTQTVAQYEDEDDELLQPAEEVREDTVESSVALDIVDLLNSKELNGTEQLVATDDNLISTDPANSHFTNIDLGQGLLIPDLNAADAASLTTDFADFSLNSPSPVDLKPPNLDLQNLDDNDIPTGKLIGIE
ncbi:PRKCA-binding protein isoform X4 [Nilaparvata lugens]|uniref:PRKCA-binding protein isoform X3 n=1 Tax=Nilaparvata lugens TaxID=108931 RepID=UPI00193E9DBA|nr:PRKCA-binding protein isoform X3 [Nilaparvata lugens]XP_039284937.1 PRKCA-binding protein isoform X4 [Nilaparvata lugens]